jgi:nucleoid DNA-binding protein
MDTLTKKAIIDEIVLSTGLSINEASEAIETLLDIIKLQLEKGDDVCIA